MVPLSVFVPASGFWLKTIPGRVVRRSRDPHLEAVVLQAVDRVVDLEPDHRRHGPGVRARDVPDQTADEQHQRTPIRTTAGTSRNHDSCSPRDRSRATTVPSGARVRAPPRAHVHVGVRIVQRRHAPRRLDRGSRRAAGRSGRHHPSARVFALGVDDLNRVLRLAGGCRPRGGACGRLRRSARCGATTVSEVSSAGAPEPACRRSRARAPTAGWTAVTGV